MKITLPIIVLANTFTALACVSFRATINGWNYATISLDDNGTKVCSVNSYGDNNGWRLNCQNGWSAYLNFSGGNHVDYSTPDGNYRFATSCTYYYQPYGGGYNVCLARVYGC